MGDGWRGLLGPQHGHDAGLFAAEVLIFEVRPLVRRRLHRVRVDGTLMAVQATTAPATRQQDNMTIREYDNRSP